VVARARLDTLVSLSGCLARAGPGRVQDASGSV
jgi:hypothetical protein